jgi:outer membrane lipoprotein SlyB
MVAKPPPAITWMRPGTVTSVKLIAHDIEGNSRAGAAVGMLIGALVFAGGDWTGSLIGALAGAGLGASSAPRTIEVRTYQVSIQWDDGADTTFVFHDKSPFETGQRVALTPQGLKPMARTGG